MLHLILTVSLCLFARWADPAAPQPQVFPGIETPAPTPLPLMGHAVKDLAAVPGSTFVRHFTTDELGRTIVFYVREPQVQSEVAAKLPVVLYVQGSGSQSVFSRVEKDGVVRAAASGGQGAIAKAAGERAIVVIAEKPGVRFMESPSRPGSAEEASPEFREEHTLPRWSEAVSAALKASLTLPEADASRVLVVGHSEGGLVACKVAADNPAVSHVATLAGGGATQLFDLIELARQGHMGGGRDPESRVKSLLDQWENVLRAPDSATNDFLGHPHRRWTTFLATSPLEELKKTNAKVFIGQGLDDRAVFPVSADMLFATMKAIGRDPTYSRVPGDHGFMVYDADGKPKGDGWMEMHTQVAEWFLGPDLGRNPTPIPPA